MRKIIFIFFLLSGMFLYYSCKPNYNTKNERSQFSDKEIVQFISNVEETIDLLEILLEKMDTQLIEKSIKIEELEERIYQLENRIQELQSSDFRGRTKDNESNN
jgi:uncharacterized coiled-coil protein SlyX